MARSGSGRSTPQAHCKAGTERHLCRHVCLRQNTACTLTATAPSLDKSWPLRRNPAREFCSGSYNFCRFSIWASTQQHASRPPTAGLPLVSEDTVGQLAMRASTTARGTVGPQSTGEVRPRKGLLGQALDQVAPAEQHGHASKGGPAPPSAGREGLQR